MSFQPTEVVRSGIGKAFRVRTPGKPPVVVARFQRSTLTLIKFWPHTKLDAWCFPLWVWREALNLGIETIEFLDTEQLVTYSTNGSREAFLSVTVSTTDPDSVYLADAHWWKANHQLELDVEQGTVQGNCTKELQLARRNRNTRDFTAYRTEAFFATKRLTPARATTSPDRPGNPESLR